MMIQFTEYVRDTGEIVGDGSCLISDAGIKRPEPGRAFLWGARGNPQTQRVDLGGVAASQAAVQAAMGRLLLERSEDALAAVRRAAAMALAPKD